MADLVAELSQRAHALLPEQRARLSEELLASLDPHDLEVDAALDAEIRRRIQEVESASVVLVTAEDAFDQIRRAIRR